MSDDSIDLPDSINIPIPEQRPRGYGIYTAKNAPNGLRTVVRCPDKESNLIRRACYILGDIPPAAFMRDVAVNAAEKIVELADAHHRRNRS